MLAWVLPSVSDFDDFFIKSPQIEGQNLDAHDIFCTFAVHLKMHCEWRLRLSIARASSALHIPDQGRLPVAFHLALHLQYQKIWWLKRESATRCSWPKNDFNTMKNTFKVWQRFCMKWSRTKTLSLRATACGMAAPRLSKRWTRASFFSISLSMIIIVWWKNDGAKIGIKNEKLPTSSWRWQSAMFCFLSWGARTDSNL